MKIKHTASGKVSVTDRKTGAKLTYTPGEGPIEMDPNAIEWMRMAVAMYRELTYVNPLTVFVRGGSGGPVLLTDDE